MAQDNGKTRGQRYGRTSGSQGSNSSITRQTSDEMSDITFYSYSDIRRATSGLSDILRIGKWRYGNVYKGYLDKKEVVIKTLDTEHDQGKDEFLKELKILKEIRHPNLVKLLGACIESRTLVYELLPVLSLEDCLDKNPQLCTWQIRTRIIYQLCSALIFLYSNHYFPIIHGYLNPSYIYLDTNLNIKVFLPGRSPSTNPRPKGRFTECIETGNLKLSSDAYSFGIMVLTLLTGHPAPGIKGEVQDEWLRRNIDSKAGSWPFQLAKKLAYFGSKFCNDTKDSSAIEIAEELGAILGAIDKFTNKEPLQPSNNKEMKRVENSPPPPAEFVIPSSGGYGSTSRRKSEDTRVKPSFKPFSPKEIQDATNNFSWSLIIGHGGYGKVYKCQLDNWDVAVKILDDQGDQGLREYTREMEVLETMRHENLIHLMGTCFKFRALIYEYLPNGSLEDCLKDRPGELTWEIRTRIVYEICTALRFLHANKPEPLVHSDLKPHSVLLGANFKVKLADFGLCHYLTHGENSKAFLQTKHISGTDGYMDPDYLFSGNVTPGIDVYSLGMTVVRILTGQQHPRNHIFRKVHLAKKAGSLMSIVDPTVRDWPEDVVDTLARFALRSTKPDRDRSELLGSFHSELEKILNDENLLCSIQVMKPEEDGANSNFSIPVADVKEFLHSDYKVSKSIKIESYGTTSEDEKSNVSSRASSIRVFSYLQIEGATNGLSESSKIGQGGYGSVYKGYLDNTEVAVKMLDARSKQGPEEFIQELEVLGRMRHPNLVRLIGACFKHHSLVYEFLSEGSLEDLLKNRPGLLTWQMRTRIVYEICSALIFLHSNKPQPLVHGDLKPANILLDSNFNSKLADFGLCRFLPEGTNTVAFHQTANIKGTEWYIDPDFLEAGKLSPGCDVYSFGVTILRILTGATPARVVMKVYRAHERKKVMTIVDPTAGPWPDHVAEYLACIGLKCCEPERRNSELMMEISTGLKDILAKIGA